MLSGSQRKKLVLSLVVPQTTLKTTFVRGTGENTSSFQDVATAAALAVAAPVVGIAGVMVALVAALVMEVMEVMGVMEMETTERLLLIRISSQ